jgi:hypothetical protein
VADAHIHTSKVVQLVLVGTIGLSPCEIKCHIW